MPEEKLIIDFISSQLRIGVRNEKIRSDLLANGWTDIDVDKAFGIVKFRAEHKHKLNPVLILSIVILFIIAFGLGVYFYTNKNVSPVFSPENVVTFPDLDPVIKEDITIATTTTKIDTDLVSIKDIFEKQVNDFKYVRSKREGERMIVTGIPRDDSSTTTTRDFVFVSENNSWILSMIETQQREDHILELASSTKVTLFTPEVINIKAWPSPPLVNSVKTYVDISIKNTGNTDAPKGIDLKVAFNDKQEASLSYKKPIAPLETIVIKYYPYQDKNKKYTDKPGKYDVTVYIEGEPPYSKTIDLY